VSRYRLSLGLLVIALVAGCAGPGYYGPEQSGLIQANYAAADALLARTAQALDPTAPVLVPAALNMDGPNDTSALGRVIAEQISARLTNRGVAVISSRDVGETGQRLRWQAVVIVSYAVARSYVYVNVKLVNTQGNIVSSAYDYTLPLTRVVSGLLPGNQLKY
jgi:hypothetical protein